MIIIIRIIVIYIVITIIMIINDNSFNNMFVCLT